ncbi:MAG: hypothetical protein R6V85_20095 [Polyangia bacterium]
MSNKSDYEQHASAIQAIPDKEAKYPNMPIGIFLQEAEDLHAWASHDLDELKAHGLDPALVEALPTRTGAARYAQSMWNSRRFTREEAQKKFALLAPEAYDLQARLVHSMLFAYRKNPDVKGRVQAIAEGSGDADMVQDLSDLAVHGKDNPEPLEAINFEMSLLDQAASKSDELGALLGVAHGEEATDKEVKIMRDKAYTFLKQAVDEVREYGRFVFWRDESRAVGYASEYHRKKPKSPGNDQPSDDSGFDQAP